MRLAWYSPLPPLASGIADYSHELLPFIAQNADVDVVSPGPRRRRRLRVPSGVALASPTEAARKVERYDAIFYHLGNNPHHQFVYLSFLEHPGIAVFHDFTLHHMLFHLFFQEHGRRDWVRYREMLAEEHAEAGRRAADLRFRGVASDFEKFLFPLNRHVARGARTIVAHNRETGDRLADAAPGVPVSVIPHYAPRPPSEAAGLGRAEARRRLGLPAHAFLVGHFGFMTVPKQPAAVLGGFARLVADRPDARLVIVGADHSGGGLQRLVDGLGLRGRVLTTGFVDLLRFHLYLKAVDAVVNLRYPSAGESSGTVARALGEGRVVIVNDIGSFAELPPDVALKVQVDGNQAEEVGHHLRRVSGDAESKQAQEERARDFARTALDIRRIADRYLAVAASVAGGGDGPGEQPEGSRPAVVDGARDVATAMGTHARLRPLLQDLHKETLPPSGSAAFVDVLYRVLLRRPAEDRALRESQLLLGAGSATRSDLARWVFDSAEFREVELVEATLRDLRSNPRPFTIGAGEHLGPDTTERAVEIPWSLSRIGPAGRVLDVGYAYAAGYYLSALLSLPVERLHGLDRSPGPAPGVVRVQADVRAMPYRDASFDVVVCISTIEHVGRDNTRYGLRAERATGGDAAALAEIARVVAPGGRCIISVPFGLPEEQSWFVQYDRARWRRLVETTPLQVVEEEIFELAAGGWERAEDLDVLERLPYGHHARAARGVLCAVLRRP